MFGEFDRAGLASLRSTFRRSVRHTLRHCVNSSILRSNTAASIMLSYSVATDFEAWIWIEATRQEFDVALSSVLSKLQSIAPKLIVNKRDFFYICDATIVVDLKQETEERRQHLKQLFGEAYELVRLL